MDEQMMRAKFAERVNVAHGWEPPEPVDNCCEIESMEFVVWKAAWQACAAALSQPAAQGDSSHPAGGECDRVQGPGPTDAERYQWMRKGEALTVRCGKLTIHLGANPDYKHAYPEALDKAIDAAILAKAAP